MVSEKLNLSVIIVNYNTRDYLDQCLTSLSPNLMGIRAEVIVVDNCSTDGSIEMIKRKFPQVKLLCNYQNLGFAKANNQAFAVATGACLLLLNSDTKALGNSIGLAVERLMREPALGALTIKILNEDGSVQHPCYLGYPSLTSEWLSLPFLDRMRKNSNRFGKFLPANDEEKEVFHATGACLFVKREAYQKAGALDESLIFSYEDADWCWRIKNVGYKIIYFPQAIVIHYGGKSLRKFRQATIPMILISKYRFFRKYYGELACFLLVLIQLLQAKLYIDGGLLKMALGKEASSQIRYYLIVIGWHLMWLNPARILIKEKQI